MIICGLKLTHDGAIALVEDGKLIFSTEIEKLNNNPRYADIKDTDLIAEVLLSEGYHPEQVDIFAIDGWGGFDPDALAVQPRLEIGEKGNRLDIAHQGRPFKLDIARYRERDMESHVLESESFEKGLQIGSRDFSYESYLHVAGHIMSTYASSPFSRRHEASYILIWDGGMFPRLYYFDPEQENIENLGPIFMLIGNIYTIFSQHFGPFKVKGKFAKDDLSIAGKVMAYIALGEVREELIKLFDQIYREGFDQPMGYANKFASTFKERIEGQEFKDEDILRSFHEYMARLLVEKLNKKIKRHGKAATNFCYAGGCALNIKWNSYIRNSGIFKAVYVPPFPNDSGSAIGNACAAMWKHSKKVHLEWDVYAGPRLRESEAATNWKATSCSLDQLAKLLHEEQEPVVVLQGRAELGPRALGNRSILAAPTGKHMKEKLNEIKIREAYRPISPICLEDRAPQIFTPGTPDPYMLFDHRVKEEWLDKIPAVVHLDQTARLQTLTPESHPAMARLLEAYESYSGVPMLCNTSANYKGTGFFPDVMSATTWGTQQDLRFVWAGDTLYENMAWEEKSPASYALQENK